MAASTRQRIISEALRLFAEKGYAATSIGAIEKAAGLSPRSGALYTHFASKEKVMAAAVDDAVRLAESGFALAPMLPLGDLRAELTLVARASLALMDNWRDLIRVMTKECDLFPAVMADARTRLFAPSHAFLAEWLATRAPGAGFDFEALAVIWLGALENYWLTRELHGGPLLGMDEERFVRQWVATLTHVLGGTR
ncbi:TetR/AcrR family transcriptional regulator [Actinomadura parmotrematis]|uniref:TetR/AcrR family transcriptional regulator n=1 Tax=Actinomadura parmotrematis TaxID=2864039 RepID=A0ABS7FZK4_9ACTN|nr:TetR/AcrR family transcriptional regulator [Actinomadura parmotrematis]MBW8485696.1 TetR/AcrR family transcriptional regulator [Actinomadura parmotrematis]